MDYSIKCVYFYITAICNLQCRHCYFEANSKSSKEMSSDMITKKIEETIAMGMSGLKLTGGEPFCSKNIDYVLDFCSRKELSLTIETNATLIGRERANLLRRLNAFIGVSIDSADETVHDTMRGVKGAFSNTMKALEYLRQEGCTVGLMTAINRENSSISSIRELIRLSESLGAISLKINIIKPLGRASQMSELILDIAESIELNKRIEQELVPMTSININVGIPMAFKSLSVLKRSFEAHQSCNVKHMIGLLPDGRWSLCGNARNCSELAFGESTLELSEIWSHASALQQLRSVDLSSVSGVCNLCLMRTQCRGNCPAFTFIQTGTFRASFPFCQEAFMLGLFPASRLEIGNEACAKIY